MKCKECQKETGEEWKTLCSECFQKKQDKKIIRQSCLKCSAMVFNTNTDVSTASLDAIGDKVIQLAEKFVEWVEKN